MHDTYKLSSRIVHTIIIMMAYLHTGYVQTNIIDGIMLQVNEISSWIVTKS